MAEGFASGFQKGFGLVNSFYDRQSQDEYRQGLLAQRQEEAAATAQFRENQLKANAQFRSDTLEEQRRRNLVLEGQAEADDKARAEAAKYRREKDKRDAQIAQGQIDYNAARLAGQLDDNRRAREREENILKTQNAAIAANKAFQTLESIERGDTVMDSQQLYEALEGTTGSLLDYGIAIDPATFQTEQEIVSEIQRLGQTGKVKGSAVLKATNLLLNQTNQNGVGEEIDESFANAPDWMKKGGYTIKSKEFIDLKMNPATEDSPMSLTGKVLVTVQNAAGNENVYIAPATEGRSGVGAQVSIPVQDFIQSMAGFMNYTQALRRHAPTIRQAQAETMFRDRNGRFDAVAYEAQVQGIKNQFIQRMEATSSRGEQSPVRGMTNEAFAASSREFTEWAQHKALFPGRGIESNADALQDLIGQINSIPEVQQLETQRKQMGMGPLDIENLLEAQQFFTKQDDGTFTVDDRKALNQWRNRLIERNTFSLDMIDEPTTSGLHPALRSNYQPI